MARLTDGISQYLQSASALTLSGSPKLTVAFWLWWDSYSTDGDNALEYAGNVDGSILFAPNWVDGLPRAYISDTGYTPILTADFTRPSAAAWHHYVIAMDRSLTAADQITGLWVDGAVPPGLVNALTANVATNWANAVLNLMRAFNGILYGAGRIAEVALYSGYTFTGANATSLYNGGLGADARTVGSSLAYYWPLRGTSNPEPAYVGGIEMTVAGARPAAHPIAIWDITPPVTRLVPHGITGSYVRAAIDSTGTAELHLNSSSSLTTAINFAGTSTLRLTGTAALGSVVAPTSQLMPHAIIGMAYGPFTGRTTQGYLTTDPAVLRVTGSASLTTDITMAGSAALTLSLQGDFGSQGPWALLAFFLAFDSSGADTLTAQPATLRVTATATLTTDITLTASPTLVLQTSPPTLTTDITFQTPGVSLRVVATLATLTTAIRFASQPTLRLTGSATLTTGIELGATATLRLTGTANLLTAISLTNGPTVLRLTGASALVVADFVGQGTLRLSGTANLTTGGTSFSGSAALTLQTQAALTTSITFSAVPVVTLTTSPATLTTDIRFAAVATLRITASASLTTGLELTGQAALTLTGIGSMAVAADLTGSAALQLTTTSATLTTTITLAPDPTATRLTVVAVSSLTTGIRLSSFARLVLNAVGTLEIQIPHGVTFIVKARRRDFIVPLDPHTLDQELSCEEVVP